MYSGRQPASTALIATFSAVMDTARGATKPISCVGARRAASSSARTLSSVGGTTGRPSDQPCAKQNSIASAGPSTWYRFDVSAAGIAPSWDAARRAAMAATLPPGRGLAQARDGRAQDALDVVGDERLHDGRTAARRDERAGGVADHVARAEEHPPRRAGGAPPSGAVEPWWPAVSRISASRLRISGSSSPARTRRRVGAAAAAGAARAARGRAGGG